jgi:hypothetical protein
LSNGNGNGEAEVVVESLVGVIAGISRIARDTSTAVQQSTSREQEALKMLDKFKSIAKQQKDLIDLHEAQRREEAETRIAVQPPPPISTAEAGSGTELSGHLIEKLIEDEAKLRVTLDRLDEKEILCAQLEEKLLSKVVENRKLKLVVKHAQGVIEAQKVLLDDMRDARKSRGYIFGRSRTPSRENTPIHSFALRSPPKSGKVQAEKAETTLSASSLSFPYIGEDTFDGRVNENKKVEEEVKEEEKTGGGKEEESPQEYSHDESELEREVWSNSTESISIDTSFDLIQQFYRK